MSNFSPDQLKDFIEGIVDVNSIEDIFATVIYGKNGTGKTRTSSTFPKPILIADIKEKGTKSVKGSEGIKARSIERWEDVEMLYWFLKTQNHKLKTPFKTVVFDTITQLELLALRYVMNKEAKDMGFDVDSQDDMKMPYRQDYGKAAALLKAWVMRFRDLIDEGIYVVFNIQEKKDGSDELDEDDHEVFPQTMPSIRGIICGAVSYVIHTEIREVTKTVGNEIKTIPIYVARTGPSSKYLTKVRTTPGTVVPQFIVNPSYEQLIQLSEGKHPSQNKKTKNNKNVKEKEEE